MSDAQLFSLLLNIPGIGMALWMLREGLRQHQTAQERYDKLIEHLQEEQKSVRQTLENRNDRLIDALVSCVSNANQARPCSEPEKAEKP